MTDKTYKTWTRMMNSASMEIIGCPFRVVCHDPKAVVEAFESGRAPREFVESFKNEHYPKQSSEMFI